VRGTVAVGAALAMLYLAGAALTARLDPLQGRALLDGSFTGAPYNWVNPPPALAASNKAPTPLAQSVPISPESGSDPVGLSTNDLQVTLLLSKGAFPPSDQQDSVDVRITPLAPTGGLPRNNEPQGNVYRIQATYRPGGASIDTVTQRAQLVLVYPAPVNPGTFVATIFVSPDGRTWTALRTTTSAARHQALAETGRLGYFVVGAPPSPSATGSGGGGGLGGTLRILLVAALVVGAGLAAWFASGRWFQRRVAEEEARWRDDEDDA
jgi:hypothetical protein